MMIQRSLSWFSGRRGGAVPSRTTSLRAVVLFAAFALAGCQNRSDRTQGGALPDEAAGEAACESIRAWPGIAPDVTPEHRTLSYWLEHPALVEDMDRVLMSDADIGGHNAAMYSKRVNEEPLLLDLALPLDAALLQNELTHRIESVQRAAKADRYFLASGEPAKASLLSALASANRISTMPTRHVATGDIHVRCAPVIHSFYTKNLDLAFDRNNCSVLKEGEPFIVIDRQRSPRLIRAGFTMGWIADDAPHTPPIEEETFARYVRAPQARYVDQPQQTPRLNAVFRYDPTRTEEDSAQVWGWRASASGLEEVQVPRASLVLKTSPFTRRALLEQAFSMLGEEYGWGGRDGFRDCSRFLMDSLGELGVRFPRHSGIQQYAGDFWIDLDEATSEQKLSLMEAANQRGVVLLHMNGHIMLYLGRTLEGEPMVLHSFAEYVEPCPEGTRTASGEDETLVVVNQVDVSTLRLGEGTSRRSFLERIDRVTVLGGTPGHALEGLSTYRSAAPVHVPSPDEACTDDSEHALLTAPYYAHTQGETTLVYAAEENPGPVSMALVSPSGQRIDVDARRKNGPPYSLVARQLLEETGTWRLAVGDGSHVRACREFRVGSRPQRRGTGNAEAVWSVRNAWDRRFENLYSVFLRELTDYALEDEPVWRNMHELLIVPEKNILFSYLGPNEDEALRLQPDCADFPYMARAYFAWKMGLPFSYRRCNRGREGRPPTCQDIHTNEQPRDQSVDVDAFNHWGRRVLMSAVHSGNGRTHPDNHETDLYPVALSREALRPGVVYADPDGHVLMIADWVAQDLHGYGSLIAVDAQPDGTIGLRRFWRGTFGFRPDIDSVGAGFKAFRPVVREGEGWRSLRNDELDEETPFTPYSRQQYEGSTDDFYDTMETLINPRPQDPEASQLALIDALELSVRARVHSVKLGVDAMSSRRWPKVEMPKGYSIFETSGLWEDFATPSRDMRILFAIDAVTKLSEQVRRSPEHYGFKPEEADEALAALEAFREEQLSSRTFEYERSDGSMWELSLLDVVERAEGMEMAYNINDCPERRWAAPEGSEELQTCTQRAPASQLERMESYRSWFANRRRPAR